MSFTVQHVKNGKIIPIKLSIWDAFKGVPNPKPRKPKPCTCCKQVHSTEKVTAASPAGNKKDGDTKNNDESNKKSEEKKSEAKPDANIAGAQGHSNRAEETYSADDDATIIAMKTAGQNWKDILAAINKESLSQLKSHWKLIDPTSKETEGGKEKTTDADAEAKKKEEEEKQAKIEKAKAEGQAAKKKKKDQEKSNPITEKENEKAAEKSITATNDMKTFASQYDKQKWKAAASRHFDLTGQRISPETARKMAEE